MDGGNSFYDLLLLLIAIGGTLLLVDWLLRMPLMGKLHTRYILVTGCDSGFGQGIAKRLDKMGCHVFAACLTEKGEIELQKSCSTRLKTLHLDVTDHKTMQEAYDFINANLPAEHGLWAVVNNAGIWGSNVPMEWLQLSDYRTVLDVNLLGTINTTTAFLPLVKRARGRIVNVSSVLGRLSLTKLGPYCISKYGVEAFSDAIRRQLKPFNVTVHIIEPSKHITSLYNFESVIEDLQTKWQNASQESKAEYGEKYFQGCLQLAKYEVGVGASNFKPVLDAYTHALLGKYPRFRYCVCDWMSRVLLVINTFAPESIADWVFGKIFADVSPPAGSF